MFNVSESWYTLNVGMARARNICNTQKWYNFTMNTLKAYLRKSSGFLFEYLYDQQDLYSCPKPLRKTAKRKSVWQQKCHFLIVSFFLAFFVQTTMFNNDISITVQRILVQNWCLSLRVALQHSVYLYNLQRLRSFKFTLVDKAVHSTAWLLYIA